MKNNEEKKGAVTIVGKKNHPPGGFQTGDVLLYRKS